MPVTKASQFLLLLQSFHRFAAISTNLSPRIPPVRFSPSSRAPKRDHDEWLVRWEVGWFGSRSGPGQKYRGMGQFAGQAAANARGARCRALQGARSPCIRRLGEVVNVGGCPVTGHPCSRDAARDAPELRYHKPKTPIGRRGESLIHCCGLPASGLEASPAPLHCPQKGQRSLNNPRRKRRWALLHAQHKGAPLSRSASHRTWMWSGSVS